VVRAPGPAAVRTASHPVIRAPATPAPAAGDHLDRDGRARPATDHDDDHHRYDDHHHRYEDPYRDRAEARDAAVSVTAVLVCHDGERWLPTVLRALAEQVRPPDRLVAVDVASVDATPGLLAAAVVDGLLDAVVPAPRSAGFGASVALALQTLPAAPGELLWLLHDDGAPADDALAALLWAAAGAPSAAVLGPKVLGWDDPAELIEVGLRVDRGGHRVSGLEPGEIDQGQHEAVRDVLAVGTAGALVRRAHWEELGGLDPELPLFQDDVDLGWRTALAGRRVLVVPAARLRHARAAASGLRVVAAVEPRPRRVDRRHAVYVQAANASALALAPVLARLVLGGLLGALVALLTRRPHHARDELAAVGSLLGGLPRLRGARRRRAGRRDVPAAPRPLLAGRATRLRARVGAAGELLTSGAEPAQPPRESGADADEAEMLSAEDVSRLRAALRRPPVLLSAALLVVALVADRHLLGGGALSGGRLLPAPGGAGDLWRSWAATWHASPVGGSPTPAPPWTPLLALASTVVLGDVPLAVSLVVVLSVPVAGLSAWRATRDLPFAVGLRVWAGLTWALLPVTTGALAQGRVDVAVVVAVLPVLLRAGARLVAEGAAGPWHRAWALGLGLTVVAAVSPPVWSAAAALLALGLGARLALMPSWRDLPRLAGRGAAVLLPPALLLLPWLPAVLSRPGVLLTGLGREGGLAGQPTTAAPDGLHALLLHPGGPGLPPLWVSAPLVVAAVVALGRRPGQARRAAATGWLLAIVGFALALLASRLHVTGRAATVSTAWPGPGLAIAGAGLLLAAAAGATGLGVRLRGRAFGAVQLGVTGLVVAAALVPVVAGASWLGRGAGDPLRRGGAPLLPPDVLADAAASGDGGQRVLLLADGAAGSVRYDLHALTGPRLGDEDLATSAAARLRLDAAVRDLGADRGSDAAQVLATYDVAVVAVTAPRLGGLTRALDAQPALSRPAASRGYDAAVWDVVVPTGRAQLLPPALAASALHPAAATAGSGRGPALGLVATDPPLVLPAGRERVDAVIPGGPPGRLLVLSEAADAGWLATLDGRRLPRATAWGWAQAFVLPPGPGHLVVGRAAAGRRALLGLELLAALAVLVLAAPGGRRDDQALDDTPAPLPPAPPPTVARPSASDRLRLGVR